MNFSSLNNKLVRCCSLGVILTAASGWVSAKEILIEEKDTSYYQGMSDVTGKTLEASVGDTLKVVNNDTVLHNVTVTENGKIIYNQNQKPKAEGGKDVVIPFKSPGTVDLKCNIHPNMELLFTVK